MINLSLKEIEELEKKFGCPLYIFDVNGFKENYKLLERTFVSYYPKYHVSYSYKTNYTPYICKLVKSYGGYAEVVSGMERYIAKKIGYEDDKIIYNGPDKGKDGIEAALQGSIVNVDHLQELAEIIKTAVSNPEDKIRIGIRVNPAIGQNFVSRFGMDEADLEKAMTLVSEVPNLSVTGLQCHISRCRDLKAWKNRTTYMLNLADKYFSEKPPVYIDLGSGMYGQMDPELKNQFENVPTYEEYAQETARIVSDHYKDLPETDKPILFTEPGTTLVNKYIDFVCRVDAIKTINEKQFAILNASEHNLGETCLLKKLPAKVFYNKNQTEYVKNMSLTGYTCLEQDVMYNNYSGPLESGDYIQFGNVGGYSNVYKPPFIRPNCAMIARGENGGYKLIKQAESYSDLLHTYCFD